MESASARAGVAAAEFATTNPAIAMNGNTLRCR
jgi:hypothetical protein